MMIEITDLMTDPMVSARCARRSDSSPVDSMNELASMRSLNGRRMRGTPPRTGLTRRSTARRIRDRTTNATTMMIRIRIGISIRATLWSSMKLGNPDR